MKAKRDLEKTSGLIETVLNAFNHGVLKLVALICVLVFVAVMATGCQLTGKGHIDGCIEIEGQAAPICGGIESEWERESREGDG